MSNFMYYLLFSIVAIFLDFVRIFLNASGFLHDLVTNLFADILFIAIILLAIWGLRRRHLSKAEQFFGFDQSHPLTIYVSGFKHDGTSEGVVNIAEYNAANELKRVMENASPNKVIDFLLGLIGKGTPEQIVKDIDHSPIDPISEFPDDERAIVLIGGPCSNKYTKYLQANEELNFRFNKHYERKVEGNWEPVAESDPGIIEKLVRDSPTYNSQTVFVVQGSTETATTRAGFYLAKQWKKLAEEWEDQDERFEKLV